MLTLKKVTLKSMNYASVVLFGTIVIAAVWYGI
jgi:nitroimidazol reductase NimA-like FMN-containing flavoprotein (pyridoxamine 5'-phosphate oxidase superfamily)